MNSVFERIASNLKSKAIVYHIGGNAMCWYGLKDTTKDADLVLLDEKEIEAIKSALLDSGFIESEIVTDPSYRWLQPYGIFDEIKETPLDEEFKPGIRIDLFLKQICGGFRFSKDMKKRAKKGQRRGNLIEYFCSSEDVFLFKSITGRDRDLKDMSFLAEKGLNWNSVSSEFVSQVQEMPCNRRNNLRDIFIKSVKELHTRFGIEVPSYMLSEIEKI